MDNQVTDEVQVPTPKKFTVSKKVILYLIGALLLLAIVALVCIKLYIIPSKPGINIETLNSNVYYVNSSTWLGALPIYITQDNKEFTITNEGPVYLADLQKIFSLDYIKYVLTTSYGAVGISPELLNVKVYSKEFNTALIQTLYSPSCNLMSKSDCEIPTNYYISNLDNSGKLVMLNLHGSVGDGCFINKDNFAYIDPSNNDLHDYSISEGTDKLIYAVPIYAESNLVTCTGGNVYFSYYLASGETASGDATFKYNLSTGLFTKITSNSIGDSLSGATADGKLSLQINDNEIKINSLSNNKQVFSIPCPESNSCYYNSFGGFSNDDKYLFIKVSGKPMLLINIQTKTAVSLDVTNPAWFNSTDKFYYEIGNKIYLLNADTIFNYMGSQANTLGSNEYPITSYGTLLYTGNKTLTIYDIVNVKDGIIVAVENNSSTTDNASDTLFKVGYYSSLYKISNF